MDHAKLSPLLGKSFKWDFDAKLQNKKSYKSQRKTFLQTIFFLGGSPGLVVTGGDLTSEGCGFESQHCVLHGHYCTIISCKIVLMFVWKWPKLNEKEAGDGQFFL